MFYRRLSVKEKTKKRREQKSFGRGKKERENLTYLI